MLSKRSALQSAREQRQLTHPEHLCSAVQSWDPVAEMRAKAIKAPLLSCEVGGPFGLLHGFALSSKIAQQHLWLFVGDLGLSGEGPQGAPRSTGNHMQPNGELSSLTLVLSEVKLFCFSTPCAGDFLG